MSDTAIIWAVIVLVGLLMFCFVIGLCLVTSEYRRRRREWDDRPWVRFLKK